MQQFAELSMFWFLINQSLRIMQEEKTFANTGKFPFFLTSCNIPHNGTGI